MNLARLRAIHNGLMVSQRWIMGSTTIAFSVLVFVQVVIRYLLDSPLYGVEEVSIYLAVWLYFVGAGYGVYRDNHISASVMDLILSSERSRELVCLLVAALSLTLTIAMLWVCLRYLQWSVKFSPKSPELRLPLCLVHVAMVVGMALMGFYYLIEIVRRTRCLIRGERYRSLAEEDELSAVQAGEPHGY
ncbi:TRAP transporter small permease [Halomonas nitroreducens]|uniref:TRAP transporter small permease protein n=1 Tax=Halomonas nitroreducens TaxID=447425 RepID=A0A431V796_9GAMM|nr:TRAP transporter small permease [Halomonas nitroreducens]RTR06896.1 TRAP transporter small permease [Halomonas nitroreducens]